MLVSDVEQSDLVTCVPVSILSQILFLFMILEKKTILFAYPTVDLCWLAILNTAVCTCQFQMPSLFLPQPFPSDYLKFVVWVSDSVSVLYMVVIFLEST